MSKYKFEIQSCIGVVVEADSAEEARMILVDNPSLYKDDMIKDQYISGGEKIKE